MEAVSPLSSPAWWPLSVLVPILNATENVRCISLYLHPKLSHSPSPDPPLLSTPTFVPESCGEHRDIVVVNSSHLSFKHNKQLSNSSEQLVRTRIFGCWVALQSTGSLLDSSVVFQTPRAFYLTSYQRRCSSPCTPTGPPPLLCLSSSPYLSCIQI